MVYLLRKLFTITLIIVGILFTSTIYAKPPIFVHNYDDARQLSKDLNIDIVIIFSADWCSYCHKQLDEISLNLDKVGDTIFCILDFDKDSVLVKKYTVKKIPTTFFMKQGTVSYEHIGYMPIDQIVKWNKK